MSPEQCQSARDVGPPTDVYALGVAGYEMLCRRPPFSYDNSAELIVAHQMETPPHPRACVPALSTAVADLLFAMLAKDPGARPTLTTVRATIASERLRPAVVARPRAVWFGGAAAAAALVLAAAVALRGRADGPHPTERTKAPDSSPIATPHAPDPMPAVEPVAPRVDPMAAVELVAPRVVTVSVDAGSSEAPVAPTIVDPPPVPVAPVVTAAPPRKPTVRPPVRPTEPPPKSDPVEKPSKTDHVEVVDDDRTFNPFDNKQAR
jgi:serine/threonine-protein kinase